MALKLLVIDDDSGISDLLENIAQRCGHQTTIVNDSSRVEELLPGDFDLVFLDIHMPGLDGIQVMRIMANYEVSSALVLMSGFDKSVLNTAHELAVAHNLNILSHLMKPFKLKDVQEVFEMVEQQEARESVQTIAPNQMQPADIAAAIKDNRIEMRYQPQMDLKSNRILGLEALCRIRLPNNQIVGPDYFIAAAEQADLIHELTLHVANIVAKDFAELSAEYHGVTVSLNVSTQDLEVLEFPDELEQIFSEYKLDPHSIIVEVTETLLMQTLDVALDVLARIRLKGFKVSIDDFGKGAAALEHIKHFPATELKIDKEFVQGVGETDKSHVLVRHTLDLAHQLDLDVVAEGVESEEVAKWLKDNGCDIAQGFWLSRPLPKTELVEFLQQALEGIEGDSTYTPVSHEGNLEHLQSHAIPEDQVSKNHVLVSTILPLSGSLSFVGKSQLFGIKAALQQHQHSKDFAEIDVKLEVFDDESDINRYSYIAKHRLSKDSLACLGGVMTLGNVKWFVPAALAIKRAVIGPFSGSVILRNQRWNNIFNVRPSYEDELNCIIEKLRGAAGKVLLVCPDNVFGQRAQAIVDKSLNVEVHAYSTENRSHKYLISEINQSDAKHIIFIGGAKTLADLVNEVQLSVVDFYSISLIGTGMLAQTMHDCRHNIAVTAPIDDYQSEIEAAKGFRESIQSVIEEHGLKYMNSISFESYLNAQVLLKGLDRAKSYTRNGLIQALESLEGADIGLPYPITWSADNRQFLHHVNLLEDQICH